MSKTLWRLLSVGKEFMIDVAQMAKALENFDLTKTARNGVQGQTIL